MLDASALRRFSSLLQMDRKWAQAVGQRLPTHVERTTEREEWKLRMRMRIEEGGGMLRLIDEMGV